MQQQPANAFSNPEIIKRLLITLGCITAYIFGRNIPTPGLGSSSIVALGVTPYVGAAVLLSLLRAGGRFSSLAGKDIAGRAEIYRIARFVALPFAVAHAAFLAAKMPATPITLATAALTLTAGAFFVLWLAEEITENGITNGVLLILFVDIAAEIPGGIHALNTLVDAQEIALPASLGICALVLFALYAAVKIETAQRRLHVQYGMRVVGRKMMGGQQTTVPIKVNPAGALALIAAATVLAWPAALAAPLSHPAIYFPLFAVLAVFFSRLYRNVGVDPREIAAQIQQSGGHIVGTRGGEAMFGYISKRVDNLSTASALPVAAAAVVPALAVSLTGTSLPLGPVAIYLLAAVALDTMSQVQTRVMMQGMGNRIPQPGAAQGGGQRRRPPKKRKRRR